MDDSDEVPPVEAVEDAEEVRPAKKARTNWKELTATAKPNPNEGGGLFEFTGLMPHLSATACATTTEYVVGMRSRYCHGCGSLLARHKIGVRGSMRPRPGNVEQFLSIFCRLRNARVTVMALALGELVKGKDTHKILEEVKRQLTEVSRQVEDLPDTNSKPRLMSAVKEALGPLEEIPAKRERPEGAEEEEEQGVDMECVKKSIEVAMNLDGAYFWMYYMCTMSFEHGHRVPSGGSSLALPPPLEYYSVWCLLAEEDVDRQEKVGSVLGGWDEKKRRHLGEAERSIIEEATRILDGPSFDTTACRNPLYSIQCIRWVESQRVSHALLEGGKVDTWDALVPCGMGTRADETQTLKQGDPLMPSKILSDWVDSTRDYMCHIYAYATPTESALELLSSFVPGGVVEVGSGTGYWAKLLRDRNVKVLALDKNPPDHQANAYHGRCRPHTEVKKNAADLQSLSAEEYPKLMLCYPPPQEHMAAEAIGNFKGDYVYHIGEWFGDTGTLAMQKALGQGFRMIRREPLPNWPSTSYEMTIWKRRSNKDDDKGENALPAVACSHCGRKAQVRCRVTCEIAYCNKEECLDAHRSRHRTLMAFKMVPVHKKLMTSLKLSNKQALRKLRRR
ncbi:hypothetical protein Pmar_PMAR023229 [Perkinsus marinus ATCC 50983]|uniref:MYND-type domain-containing protein n=1 Tax=Perkinsus marinus (strain ATCC 50983 / TXsc) TaxID=423536 RepID=C5LJI8_PERM5|nr:hypothetical protein Pmar_PMAR023229 [Perkinsus marinus ATCC 50983]EER03117.1 hypothetical protein Pmar_PMAR023229 [Perkinsus marinus ATCC 50983]|eukprot:XP_002771301.1 hypothetical protein Pmar_PMAR023229 [Perkinsus marinus ATCC 50983]